MDNGRSTRGSFYDVLRSLRLLCFRIDPQRFSLQIQNYFVAAGMKTIEVSAAGGTGQQIVKWIRREAPKHDFYELEINRFLGLHDNPKFLKDRVREVPGKIGLFSR